MYAALSIPVPPFGHALMSTKTVSAHAENVGKRRETKSARFGFVLEPSLRKKIRDFTLESGEDESEFARRAILNELAGRKAEVTESSPDLEAAPLLDTAVACGPPGEARSPSSLFVVSKPTADEISLSEGDVFIRARGFSMEGAGVLDEYLVLVEPLKAGKLPRRGQPALVQIFLDEDREPVSTLKRWDGESNGKPRLLDGDGNVFDYPSGTVGVRAVGVAKGVIGAL